MKATTIIHGLFLSLLLVVGVQATEPKTSLANTLSLPPALSNISVRGHSQSLILGFVISGTDIRTLLIRGLGPAIAAAPFNVPGTLPDPKITLRRQDQTILAQNEDWDGTVASKATMAEVALLSLAVGSKDAVIIIRLAPGVYTVQLTASERNPQDGIGLIELYDLSQARGENLGSKLINASIRLTGVGTGDNSAIVGFVFNNIGSIGKVLVRAIGPSLSSFGVANPMPNPSLTIYNGRGEVFGFNDNWMLGTANAAVMSQNGAFPLGLNSLDSAILLSFPVNGPTSFTGVVPGTGEVLLEVYSVL